MVTFYIMAEKMVAQTPVVIANRPRRLSGIEGVRPMIKDHAPSRMALCCQRCVEEEVVYFDQILGNQVGSLLSVKLSSPVADGGVRLRG